MKWHIALVLLVAVGLAGCERRVGAPLILPTASPKEAQPAATPLPQISAPPQDTLPAPVAQRASPAHLLGFKGRFYTIQPGSPQRLANFAFPDMGCNWSGIGGQVFSQDGQPLNGLVVEVSGTLEGKPILGLSVTGSARLFGPGGFLVSVANHIPTQPVVLELRLYDITGAPVSPVTLLRLGTDCQANLALLNFGELVSKTIYYFPLMSVQRPAQ